MIDFNYVRVGDIISTRVNDYEVLAIHRNRNEVDVRSVSRDFIHHNQSFEAFRYHKKKKLTWKERLEDD